MLGPGSQLVAERTAQKSLQFTADLGANAFALQRASDMTNGDEEITNALVNPMPKMDLVGPTVDDDVRRAISRYGAEAVKAAIKRQTTPKTGRPKVNDWRELRDIIEDDAKLWLEGGDPFSARSNYAIAKVIADENPGHSHPATMKRIQRKLGASPYGRKWFTLVSAWMKSEKAFPVSAYLRTVEELCELDPHGRWQSLLDHATGAINDYSVKHGEPATHLTFNEIEEGARTPLNALLGVGQPRGGLFGLASPRSGNALSGLIARYVESGKSDN